MGHIIYSIPIEEVHLAMRSDIIRTVSYKGIHYEPRNLYIEEDGAMFHLGHEVLPFGTRVNVTFLDLYEDYWVIKNRYELAESYKKKYGIREVNVWVEDYVSFDGFNEDGSLKFSTGGTIKDELSDTN